MAVEPNDGPYSEYINLNQYGLGSETEVYGFSPTTLQAPYDSQQPLDLSQSWATQFSQQCPQTTVGYSTNPYHGNFEQSNFFLPPDPGVFATDLVVMPLDNADESMAWLPEETQQSDKRLNDAMLHLDPEMRYQQAWDTSAPISSEDSSATVSPSSSFEDLPASSQESITFPLLSSPTSNEITSTHAKAALSGNTPYYTPETHWPQCLDMRSNITLATPHAAAKLALSITNGSSTSQSNMSNRGYSPESDRGGFKAWEASLCLRESRPLRQPVGKVKPSSEAQVPKPRAKQKISKAKANGQVKTLPAAVFRCHLEPCVSNASKGGKFRREEHLKRHILSVHGDTWHFCRYCDKAFKGRSDNRDAHEERHFKNTGRTKFVNPAARRARR